MGEKQQLSFKINPEVVKDLDNALQEYHLATGVKPVKQECYEAAFKDYAVKLRKQIEILKQE